MQSTLESGGKKDGSPSTLSTIVATAISPAAAAVQEKLLILFINGSRSKMKIVRLLNHSILFIVITLLVSCDFHVVKNPGRQLSWSVAQAKENNVFICSYRPSDSTINGVKIEAVFAERKYSSDGGFFSKFYINCCKSQLVVVSANYFASEGTGFSVDWDVPYFNIYSSNLIYCEYKGTAFPDSIPLSVISKKDKHIIQQITLFKVNE